MTSGSVWFRGGSRCGRGLLAVVVAMAVAGCGGGSKTTVAGGTGTTAAPGGTGSARSATGTATTANGRYRIVVTVGDRTPASSPKACVPAAAPGKTALAVTVTVTNDGTASSPFPPLRVELNAGGSPAPVQVRDSSGTCSFTPHEPDIEGGASLVLPGATPAIDAGAAPGSAGQVEVSLSENTFSLAVPVP
ncbi:MAG: hypothetical protein ACR2LJ_01950 [Acidimicrobiales bacterium]